MTYFYRWAVEGFNCDLHFIGGQDEGNFYDLHNFIGQLRVLSVTFVLSEGRLRVLPVTYISSVGRLSVMLPLASSPNLR